MRCSVGIAEAAAILPDNVALLGNSLEIHPRERHRGRLMMVLFRLTTIYEALPRFTRLVARCDVLSLHVRQRQTLPRQTGDRQ
jgi:hypothetical protein